MTKTKYCVDIRDYINGNTLKTILKTYDATEAYTQAEKWNRDHQVTTDDIEAFYNDDIIIHKNGHIIKQFADVYHQEENALNEKKIQTMLNVEILNRMNDQSAASVLKNILFNPDNHIDWNEAYQLMMAFMPELNTIEGYKKENVTTYTDFITDLDKMRDFFDMSKKEFLLFYSYLEEIEYDLTAEKLKNMTTEEIVRLKSKCDELPDYD